MAQRIRMSPVDTAWLRMDSPGNLMMITGVQVFDGPVDAQRLRALLQSHLCAYREFRSRAARDPAGAWWVEVDPNMDYHLVRMALPGAADLAQLQHCVGQLASQALDPNKPLWQMHLVENFRATPGAAPVHALIVRIHHCIADGIALVRVLLSLTTAQAHSTPPLPHRYAQGKADALPRSPVQAALHTLTSRVVQALDQGGDGLAYGLRVTREILEEPSQAAHLAEHAAQLARKVGRDVAALAFMQDDTPTSLKGKPSGAKGVAWSTPLPLAQVKAIGKALECSVNDVLLACVAGAFRAYLLDRGEHLVGAELRSLVPVNLRPLNFSEAAGVSASMAPIELGNRFGLVPLLLPIGIADVRERVLEVQQRMNELKGGTMPTVSMALLGAAGVAPRFVQQQMLGTLASKATAVMTNVPGPQTTLYMAGAALRQLMFWVPQSGDIGVGVSVLSYDGGVQFGLMTDQALCRQPEAIVAHFVPEFEALAHSVTPTAHKTAKKTTRTRKKARAA